MKKIAIIAFILLQFNYTYAQVNLVMNPSFESYTSCPGLSSDLYKAVGWDNAKNSPDYFNECGSNSAFRTPLNALGYQVPANGVAYAGLFTFDASTTNYRELIIGSLVYPLTVGQKYFASFKVSRSDSNYFYRYNTNNIGARFTKTKYNLGNPNLFNTLIDNYTHINTNNVISDTLNWVKIKGSFIADSAYRYILLGNFYDISNTIVVDNNIGLGNGAYYYIDEVCVTTDSLYNEGYNTTNLKNEKANSNLILYPNPFHNELCIENAYGIVIQIYSLLGELIYEEKMLNNLIKLNTANLNEGAYIIKINSLESKLFIKN